MSYWNIDDGNGQQLTQGIDNEVVARREAKRLANARGESVYIYDAGSPVDGSGDVPDTEVQAEEIAPD